ncbi:MAG: hypothetical protein Q4D05_00120 [Acinetobacter sp.]|nr:hypothetical protein [Acinetobacter sp.]
MSYKSFAAISSLAILLSACGTMSNTQKEPMIGGEKDKHGCIAAAGYSWSKLKKQCVQPFDIANIKFTDPKNETLAVYVILSDDKQYAEIFSANIPANTILESRKGGYVSADGKIQLLNTTAGWRLSQAN